MVTSQKIKIEQIIERMGPQRRLLDMYMKDEFCLE